MKTFKQYLAEENQNVQCDINGICKVIKGYESAGNEKKILGVYKDINPKKLNVLGIRYCFYFNEATFFANLDLMLPALFL